MKVAFRTNDTIRVKTQRGYFEGYVDYIDEHGFVTIVDNDVFRVRFNVSKLFLNDNDEKQVEDGNEEIQLVLANISNTVIDLAVNAKFLQKWQKLELAHDHLGDLGVRIAKFKMGETL